MPTKVLANKVGCDSTVTLNLTINAATTGDTTAIACTSFKWDGTTYTSTPAIAPTKLLTNKAGCDSTVTLHLTVTSVDTSVTVTGLTLTANVTTATYQWLNCPLMTHVVGETNQSFTASANGNYAVMVTQNGCTDTSKCYNITTVGINENSLSDAIRIYPNPVIDNLQIQTTLPIKEIAITDITGRLIYTTTAKTINCSSFAKGVYFIKATTEKGVVVKRIVKE